MTLSGILAAFAISLQVCSAPAITDRHDRSIEMAVQHYWPAEMRSYWCEYKAQLVEESGPRNWTRLRFRYAGARSVAQIMPATWNDIAAKAGVSRASPFDADASIRAGAYYMAWLFDRFPAAKDCFLENGQAGYNGGVGNQRRARKLAREAGIPAFCFSEWRAFLPKITGKHSRETCNYVDRIANTAAVLRGEPPPARDKGCKT